MERIRKKGAAGLPSAKDPSVETKPAEEAAADQPVAVPPLQDRFTKADAGHAEFRGVVASAGPTRTPQPDLLDEWRKAVLETTCEEGARELVFPEVEKALSAAANGRPLSRRQAQAIAQDVYERNSGVIAPEKARRLSDAKRSAAHEDQVIASVVQGERARVAGLFDPFMPVARGDAEARAGEVVLWENASAMVLVDLFADSPKALVVPKEPASFPTDLRAQALGELGALAAQVSDAFMATQGCGPSEIWLNPPQVVGVKQLHVHVMPHGLADWERSPADIHRGDDSHPKTAARMQKVFGAMQAELARRLGPAAP